MEFAGAFNANCSDEGGRENETFEYAPLDGDTVPMNNPSSPSQQDELFFKEKSEFPNQYSFDNPLYGSLNELNNKGYDGDNDADTTKPSGLNNN